MEWMAVFAGIRTLKGMSKFFYPPDKDTYGKGAMLHDELLDVAAWLMLSLPKLGTSLQDRHSFILIYESQGTMKSILDQRQHPPRFLWIPLTGLRRNASLAIAI
jgi:hypothetical protein